MQKKAKSRLRDVLIVAVCLSVFIFSLRLFWLDLNTSSSRKDKDQIATIEFKRKIAQRKYSDRVVWERLQQDSPLYDSDTIRTADGAAATVTFKDGTVLELHENTMLQVAYSEDGGLKISVNDGNVEVDTTAGTQKKAVSLSMENGSTVSLESGSKVSAASNSQSGDNSFKLTVGNAKVTSSDGKQAQTITSGETVKIEASGEIKKEPLTVTSISSDAKYLLFNNEKSAEVKLQWNASEAYEKSRIIIETSGDKNFEKIRSNQIAKDKNYISLQASSGKTYWRVYPEDAIEQAATGRITVENVKKIEAVSPVNNSVFEYRADTQLPKLNFSWEGNDYAEYYRLEVSKTADFEKPLISEDLTTTKLNVNKLEEGVYYWRVTPYYKINSIGFGDATRVSAFTIEKKAVANPPKLTLPAHTARITFTENKESTVAFQWKSDVRDADYKLQVATDKKFANVVYEKTAASKTVIKENFNLNTLPAGNYYWRVTRASAEDAVDSVSEIRQFTVEKYQPGQHKLVYPPADYAIESSKLQNLTFKWKLAAEYAGNAVETVLQVSPDRKFERNVTEVKTTEMEANLSKLASGNYYWRIGVPNLQEPEKIDYTAARKLTVQDVLGQPTIVSPLNGATITGNIERKTQFYWTEVREADYYKIKVYDRNDKLLEELTVKEKTSAGVALNPASYKWTVQAFTEESELSPRRSGKISEANFVVQAPQTVQLVTPANNSSLDGLSALRSPTVLTWRPGDKIAKSTFTLKKLQTNGTYKLVRTIENPKTQISLERLEPGKYQWTISATSPDGISLDARNSYYFTIKDIPDLQQPKLNQPYANQIIGSDYLKTNKNIYFDWASVDGATEYKFTLYQRNSDGTLKRIYEEKGLKNSEIRIRDLSIFDIGRFEWNVTAYRYAKDGYLEQQSHVAVGNFKIDFALPGKVKTIDPGKLYGE